MINICLQESYMDTSGTVLLESHKGVRTVQDAIRLLKPWTEEGDTFQVIKDDMWPGIAFVYIIGGEDPSDVFAKIFS